LKCDKLIKVYCYSKCPNKIATNAVRAFCCASVIRKARNVAD